MSRSGYDDGCDNNWSVICWRGAVQSAIRGARGQKLLADLIESMAAMPEKVLIADELQEHGAYCALGVVGKARGIPVETIDPYDEHLIAQEFDIARALAKEVVFINDEAGSYNETPAGRWQRVRAWASSNLTNKTVPT